MAAMNLRLSDEQLASIRARSELDGQSMQEVVHSALRQYLSDRAERMQSAIERVRTEDAELLDRLSR